MAALSDLFFMHSSMVLLLLSLVCLAGGGVLSLALQRRGLFAHLAGAAGGMAGGAFGAVAALILLFDGKSRDLSLPWTTAGINFSLHLDSLAAFFLLPIFILVFCGAFYAVSYLDAAQEGQRVSFHWLFFNMLAASMAMVVTAANGLVFLMAWEVMSLTSFFLVVQKFDDEKVGRAGWLYLMAAHLGAAFLFIFFLEAGRLSGTLDFVGFAALHSLPAKQALFFFLLLLIGFGSKAGLLPLHVWLPDAHPAAPSHISAIMSGVMTKTAVYGFLRIFSFLPPLPAWCGIVVLSLGISGALYGIAMAALQDDIKRSLAYSTVENIGLIFLGIGMWMYGSAAAQPAVAALALAGAMLHVWNHALFKGLLFFGAGSIVHVTGTRTLSHLGGLLRRMPYTGMFIILGSGAIAALPPLNGFISEWFLYMGILTMGQAATGGSAIFFLLLAALLALVGGLVLLVFSRLAGIALLGEPRRPQAAHVHESSWPMLAALQILFVLCLFIGLFPTIPLNLLVGPMMILSGQAAGVILTATRALPFNAVWSISVGLLLCLAAAVAVGRCLINRSGRAAATWGCGFQRPTRRMVYMAGGYSQLAQDNLLCFGMQPRTKEIPVKGIFPTGAVFCQESVDPVLHRGFAPLFSWLAGWAYMFRRLQAGQLNVYLFYIFVSTTLLLGWVMYQS